LLQWPKELNKGLLEVDPELYDIIEKEKNRQYKVSFFFTCSSLPAQALPPGGASVCGCAGTQQRPALA
jgi:hypothetical protein